MTYDSLKVELMVDEAYCQACEPCISNEMCRFRAFKRFEPGEVPFWDGSQCRACLTCVSACPHGAVIKRNDNI